MPGLIKAVEVQLLSSDLATSVIPPSTLPTFDSKPDTRAKKQILFAPVPSTSAAGQAVKKKTGVLVQVVETDDVAHAALQLTDVLTEKREARKVAAKGGAANGGGGRIMDLDDQNEGDAAAEDLDAEAKRKALPAGVEPSYPRGSGKFVISDGGDVRWTAFELQRISGLGLEEMQLGTKVSPCHPARRFERWLRWSGMLRFCFRLLMYGSSPFVAPLARRALHQRHPHAHASEHDCEGLSSRRAPPSQGVVPREYVPTPSRVSRSRPFASGPPSRRSDTRLEMDF